MNMFRGYKIFVICALIVFSGAELYGQAHTERKHIRSGNRAYEGQDYGLSVGRYKRAVDINPASYEAKFNISNALYKSEDFVSAADTLKSLSKLSELTPEQQAKVHYNLGNAQFQQQQLKEALESYKMSLRYNPADMEAKYNLAYVQELLKNQQDNEDNQDDQDNKDNQDNQNQDNKQDQNKEGEDKKDKKDNSEGDSDQQEQEQEQEQEQDSKQDKGDNDEKDNSNGESQPQEVLISKEDAEKMLQAIQEQEDKTREKMDENRAVVGAKSGKNW